MNEFISKAEKILKQTLDSILNDIYGESLKEKIEGRIKECVEEVFEENKSCAQIVFESCANRLIESNSKIYLHNEVAYTRLIELERKIDKLFKMLLRDELNKIENKT